MPTKITWKEERSNTAGVGWYAYTGLIWQGSVWQFSENLWKWASNPAIQWPNKLGHTMSKQLAMEALENSVKT